MSVGSDGSFSHTRHVGDELYGDHGEHSFHLNKSSRRRDSLEESALASAPRDSLEEAGRGSTSGSELGHHVHALQEGARRRDSLEEAVLDSKPRDPLVEAGRVGDAPPRR